MLRKFSFQASFVTQCFMLCFLLAPSLVHADALVSDTSLDYTWEAASGPVDHYEVFVSVNSGTFESVGTTPTPSRAYFYPHLRVDRQKSLSTISSSVLGVGVLGSWGSGVCSAQPRLGSTFTFC